MICESYVSAKLLGFPEDTVAEIKDTIVKIYGKTAILKEDFAELIIESIEYYNV